MDEDFGDGVTVELSGEPTGSVWEFSDGVNVACDGPGVAWSEGLDVANADGVCKRGWEHTSKVKPVKVRVGLLYDVEWSTSDGSSGEFVLEGEFTDWVDLSVGEVGTVISDGTAPPQEKIARTGLTESTYPRDDCDGLVECGKEWVEEKVDVIADIAIRALGPVFE